MRDLDSMYRKGMEIVRSCGLEPFIINEVKTSSRLRRRWGQMKMFDWRFRILYNEKLLDERLDEDFAMSVIVHEILHCVPGGMDHGPAWHQYASVVMKKYPNLRITVESPSEVSGVDLLAGCSIKYELRCRDCGKQYIRLRKSKLVLYPERYLCGECGGRLRRIRTEHSN